MIFLCGICGEGLFKPKFRTLYDLIDHWANKHQRRKYDIKYNLAWRLLKIWPMNR